MKTVEEPDVLHQRLVRWQDPAPMIAAVQEMSGRDFLEAVRDGKVPPPPVTDLVDFVFDEVGDGTVSMVLTPNESHYNPIGAVHGGIIATVLDSVMGCSVHSRLPAGTGYTTLEIKVNYLRGVTRATGPVRATGKVLHLGRQTAMAEAALVDGAGRLLAQATTTCLIFTFEEMRRR
ncbi:MAG: PaaI family thioesterase [Telmatospirillum sp.]|nr:PaaI family thioesterase [Telmatospirillum sp.]